MEALVVSRHGGHQCDSPSAGSPVSGGRYRCHPSRGLKGLSCRAFHSSGGTLPCSGTPSRSRSSPIPISSKAPSVAEDSDELWAGPAYTNSPPPSSLPIPKFSLCRKADVPVGVGGRPISMSLPASPTRDDAGDAMLLPPPLVLATWDICRILNLDVGCK